ncbi:MAG: ATP-binding cassette domain-containing protein [Actinomycetota bacterium]
MTDAITYDGVTFHYPDTSRPALENVWIGIPDGSFTLVTGPTGSGKSTLLRAANGLVPHFTGGIFSGSVSAGGRNTLDTAPRDLAGTIAYVPQDPVASFVLDRVEDELAYGMENLGIPPGQMRRRVEETLDLLDIESLRGRSVRAISGGERQRVAIAAAMAAGPSTLILDEPTSQLDPQGAEDVLAALQRLVHDHGMTVLLAEHRLERVAGFADFAVGFSEGRARIGPPSEIVGEAGPPVARLGRLVGWEPLPLTVREARASAERLDLGAPATQPSPAPGDPMVEARGLSAGYGRTEVLHDISLRVSEGEVVAVMGRNGAGKTTLLRCLAGVHAPSEGSVGLRGSSPRPGVDSALCPQEPESILFSDTVENEVRATLRARGRAETPADALGLLGITRFATRHPRDLSAGERLLVAAAAVIASGAPLLLLDEPTKGLDPESKGRLAGFLRAFAASGRAAIFATHDVELAASVASRVVMLAGGEIIADGDPATVLGDSKVFAPQMTRVFGPGWLTPEQVARAASA